MLTTLITTLTLTCGSPPQEPSTPNAPPSAVEGLIVTLETLRDGLAGPQAAALSAASAETVDGTEAVPKHVLVKLELECYGSDQVEADERLARVREVFAEHVWGSARRKIGYENYLLARRIFLGPPSIQTPKTGGTARDSIEFRVPAANLPLRAAPRGAGANANTFIHSKASHEKTQLGNVSIQSINLTAETLYLVSPDEQSPKWGPDMVQVMNFLFLLEEPGARRARPLTIHALSLHQAKTGWEWELNCSRGTVDTPWPGGSAYRGLGAVLQALEASMPSRPYEITSAKSEIVFDDTNPGTHVHVELNLLVADDNPERAAQQMESLQGALQRTLNAEETPILHDLRSDPWEIPEGRATVEASLELRVPLWTTRRKTVAPAPGSHPHLQIRGAATDPDARIGRVGITPFMTVVMTSSYEGYRIRPDYKRGSPAVTFEISRINALLECIEGKDSGLSVTALDLTRKGEDDRWMFSTTAHEHEL